MKILALDLATKTGFAHSCGESGVWDLSISKDESSGMRLIRFRGKLEQILTSVGIELIVFEEVTLPQTMKANVDSIKLASKLQAIIEDFCERNGSIQHCSHNNSAIKSHAIPSTLGNKGIKRDKPAMHEAAKAKWPGVEFIDDNHVDALWLLDLAQKQLEGA
jgi:hypothetical protein